MNFHIPPDLQRLESSHVLPLAGEINWGMEKFNVQALRNLTQGENIIMGGVDTGIDDTHPLLRDNFLKARDFTGSSNGYRDVNKHGTHISGTIASTDPRIGVMNRTKLIHGKGLSDQGSGTDLMLADAIQFCADEGAEVISCSFGSAGRSDHIVQKMEQLATGPRRIWFVCAAGNSGGNTPDVDWPGRSEFCISVAALDSNLSPASFTNRGAKIDTAGPGVGIWSTGPNNTFEKMSGTSMATPFTAGALGLYRSLLKLTSKLIPDVYELRKMLSSRSTDTHLPGDDDRTGPGWINPQLLVLNTIRNFSPIAAV